ncbi:hypothetical protein [Streptomyces sp. NPDC091040]|uniref:hypothetical protein n=1 Tax=Streptomyces sp. NPDC091040 TaxID=3365972 RepID=UPI0037F68E72
MSEGKLAAVLIFAIVLAAACYAIRHLNTTPARVGAVIVALATLVAAMVPVVQLLNEQAPPTSPQVVAPAPSSGLPEAGTAGSQTGR